MGNSKRRKNMEQKIIAKILPPDTYYDIDDFIGDDEYYKDFVVAPENNSYGFNTALYKQANRAMLEVDDVYPQNDENAQAELIGVFGTHKDGSPFTEEDGRKAIEIVNEEDDAYEATAMFMTLYDGIEREVKTIRGCCQGDWSILIYPIYCDDYSVRYFEAVWFNTGSLCSIEDGDDTMLIYTTEYDYERIKTEVADFVGVCLEGIDLYAFDGYQKTAKYKKV